MSQLITISNDILKVSISSNKAELMSIEKNGKEFIWQANSTVWTQRCPILFPICGGLKEDKYTYDGKEYTLPKHGFAKLSEFEVEKKSRKSVTFLLKSNEETLAQYPFEFELRVTYTLSHKSVIVEYDVRNKTDGDMYFSIGSHEGYACSGGVENYDIYFSRRESLQNCLVKEGCIGQETEQITKFSKTLPIYEKYFANDSLVFKNMVSRSLILRNRTNGERIKIEYPGKDYFVIWTIPGNEYICLEPWAGIPDYIDSDYDITKKPGIISLEKGKTYLGEHTLTFFDEE